LPDLPIVMFTLFKTAALDLEARKVGVRVVVGKEEGVIKLLRAIEDELAQPIIVNEPQVPPGSESPQPNDLSA